MQVWIAAFLLINEIINLKLHFVITQVIFVCLMIQDMCDKYAKKKRRQEGSKHFSTALYVSVQVLLTVTKKDDIYAYKYITFSWLFYISLWHQAGWNCGPHHWLQTKE